MVQDSCEDGGEFRCACEAGDALAEIGLESEPSGVYDAVGEAVGVDIHGCRKV